MQKSLDKFRTRVKGFIKYKAKNCSSKDDTKKLNAFKKWRNSEKYAAYTKLSGSNMYKFNFSDATSADKRCLFPNDWTVDDLKQALKAAIAQKKQEHNYSLKTQHTIDDPKHPGREIELKLVVDAKKQIQTFYPLNIEKQYLELEDIEIYSSAKDKKAKTKKSDPSPVNVQSPGYWPICFQATVYYPIYPQNAAYYPTGPKY